MGRWDLPGRPGVVASLWCQVRTVGLLGFTCRCTVGWPQHLECNTLCRRKAGTRKCDSRGLVVEARLSTCAGESCLALPQAVFWPQPRRAVREVCNAPHQGTRMVLCDGCNMGWHTHCLRLRLVPHGTWLGGCAHANHPAWPVSARVSGWRLPMAVSLVALAWLATGPKSDKVAAAAAAGLLLLA